MTKKTGLFYSYNSHKTKIVAEKIAEEFGAGIESVNAETISEESFLQYNTAILGVPTWFDGELPNYWDEFVPAIEDMDLTGKKYAIYGLGDQKGYPENFGDAVGLMANLLIQRGATVVGETSAEGYTYESSKALRNDRFVGLIIDQENQARLTPERVKSWVKEVKKQFK